MTLHLGLRLALGVVLAALILATLHLALEADRSSEQLRAVLVDECEHANQSRSIDRLLVDQAIGFEPSPTRLAELVAARRSIPRAAHCQTL